MNAEQKPFSCYDSILQEYTIRVEPLLAQLRDRVEEELNRIRHQEATLLVDRSQALQELQTAIGIDARFLLKTARFQDFFEKHLKIEPRSNRDRTTKVDDIVTNWSLARFARPLRVFGYTEKFEPDDYDDENTYASYSFNVKVAWDETTKEIGDIQAIGIHGFNDRRHESFVNLAESISWCIENFPNSVDPDRKLLAKEFSFLILYCCILLAQKPSTIEFAYNSALAENQDLWELSI